MNTAGQWEASQWTGRIHPRDVSRGRASRQPEWGHGEDGRWHGTGGQLLLASLRKQHANLRKLAINQWEFRVAYVDSRGRISCDGVEFIRQSGEHRTTFVSRYLTALGREGWSLSGIQHLGRAETAYFVLQRPLVAGAAGASAPASAEEAPPAGA